MNFRVDVHHHIENAEASEVKEVLARLARMETVTNRIDRKANVLMTFAEDHAEEMGKLNTLTTEIAADQADLIARLATPGISDAEKAEIMASLAAHRATLEAVASGYTPVPVEPGEVPGETPLPEAPAEAPSEPVEPPA